MDIQEKKDCLKWAEQIAYGRADAIVRGKHRWHYRVAAVLLAAVAVCKESMGEKGTKQEVFEEHKRKFPRHSSFQTELRSYLR